MAFGSILLFKNRVHKGHPVSSFILQSPNTTKWIVVPNENGVLVAYENAAGIVTDIKVTGGSVAEASFNITNNGELQVQVDGDLSGTATLDDDFRLRSPNGVIYKLKVTNNDEIQLETV